MALSVGVWQIAAAGPGRLTQARVDLEQQLEDWIELDPDLVQTGLTIVGRQFATASGPIDLLGLDPFGRWIVIEIKRGAVRRGAVAQALDYAACIAAMPMAELETQVDAYLGQHARSQPDGCRTLAKLVEKLPGKAEEDDGREVGIMVVGTGRDPGLERMVEFMASRCSLPITVVTFGVFQLADGQRLLIRELTESDVPPPPTVVTVDDVLARAEAEGIGADFRAVYQALRDLGLPAEVRKRAIAFTAPGSRSRCLITVDNRPTARGALNIYVAADTIAELLGISAAVVEEKLGGRGWLELAPPRPPHFADAAVALLGPVVRREDE